MTARTSALRRRRKPSLARRIRTFWVFIVLGLIAAGALVYAASVVLALPVFHAHPVDVTIDGTAVTKDEVLAAAAVDPNANVWFLSTRRIAARIEALPYVDTARIERSAPARLAIAVTEREPAACVRSGARTVTIDRRRRILQTGCARPDAVELDLNDARLEPPGATAGAPELETLLAAARVLRDAGIEPRVLSEDRFGQLVAVDTAGLTLLLGSEAGLAEKAKLVAPVVAAARPGRRIRLVDLRAPATPTVEFR